MSAVYRMPLGYGPAPGPRHTDDGEPYRSPEVQTLTAAVFATVSERKLAEILPAPFVLTGDEVVVEVHRLRNIGWLAGRGYNIVDVKIPARIRTADGELEGDYMSVLWENLADPIITGREELGFAKIFADIEDLSEPKTGEAGSRASWDGFEFFDLSMVDLHESSQLRPGRLRFHHKYVPATGTWGEADVSYPVLTPPEDPYRTVVTSWVGAGQFVFNTATFDQLPTMRHIVNRLAGLEPTAFTHAQLVLTSGVKNLDDQRRIEL